MSDVLLERLTWGEGIRVSSGSLWLSDTQGGALWTDAPGTWTSFPLRSRSNGLWILPDGSVVGAMQTERRIGRWTGERFDSYADLAGIAHGPMGDLVGDRLGGLYVDDVGYSAHNGEAPVPGRLIYVAPGGTAASVAAEGIEFPNGLALIDGGRTLVVAETWNRRLLAFDVGEDAALSHRRVYADLGDLVGPDAQPDGLCAAAGSGVWAAPLGGHRILRVESGEVVGSIDTGSGVPSACALGTDGTLFATVADPHGKPFLDAVTTRTVTCSVHAFLSAETSMER